MAGKLEPLPGTGDIWQPEVSEWVLLERTAQEVFSRYGYGELRTPVFERTEVFVRGIGDETEVVQKEMYTFEDRGGRSLTLRPEGTAGVMRAIANRGLGQGEECRVFYLGPMFRGERPAAGRRRQFHQVGVENVGGLAPAQDAECMAMVMHYLEALGLEGARLLINSRGTAEDRPAVSEAMVNHFQPAIETMCPDCQRRLATNVWRILDCKQDVCQGIISQAPSMVDLLSQSSQRFFQQVCETLDALDVAYEIDPRLVRGLDYYEHTVFEIVHDGLGAQNALAGGGRYSIYVPGSKKPVSGVGFAAGMERLLMARESLQLSTGHNHAPDVFVASLGAGALLPGLQLAQELRREGIVTVAQTEERSMKSQLRAANKLGVKLVVIQGEAEIESGLVMCKNLATSVQEECGRDQVVAWIRKSLEAPAPV